MIHAAAAVNLNQKVPMLQNAPNAKATPRMLLKLQKMKRAKKFAVIAVMYCVHANHVARKNAAKNVANAAVNAHRALHAAVTKKNTL